MAAAGEVGLQNFPKQIPFQQAVGHGQKLLDNLVEILERVRKPKINDAFLSTTVLAVLQQWGLCMAWHSGFWGRDLFSCLSYPTKSHHATAQIYLLNHVRGADPIRHCFVRSVLTLLCAISTYSTIMPYKTLRKQCKELNHSLKQRFSYRTVTTSHCLNIFSHTAHLRERSGSREKVGVIKSHLWVWALKDFHAPLYETHMGSVTEEVYS